MIRCPYCNNELEDGARFCGECGNPLPEPAKQEVPQVEVQPAGVPQTEAQKPEIPQVAAPQVQTAQSKSIYCPKCGKQLSEGTLFCDSCGFNLGASSGAAPAGTSAPAPQKDNKKKFPVAVVGIVAACAVVLIVGIVLFTMISRNSDQKTDYAMYIKERELFYSNLGKKPSTQVTEDLLEDSDISNYDINSARITLSEYFILSDDGKYLFYPDKIDTSDDGFTIYWKKISNLSGEGTKIDSDIQDYEVSDNAAYVTYLKSGDSLYSYDVKKAEKEKIAGDVEGFAASENGKQVIYINDEGTLYLWTMGGNKEKIDSDISKVVYISDDFKTMYYLKEENLYKKENKKDREKVASDVSRVIKVYDSGSIYYLTEAEEDISMDMFITDDMAETDANMQQPDYWSLSNEEYQRAWEEYNAKEQRDYLREEIADYSPYVNIGTLCYYDGKDATEVISGFTNSYSYSTAADAEAILFCVLDLDDISKVKMSKITEEDMYWYDIVDIVEEAIDNSIMYAMVQKGEVVSLDLEDIYNLRMNSDGTKIMYIEDYDPEKMEGDLRMASIKNGRMSDPEKIDTDVYSEVFGFINDSDSYLYYTDVKDRHGDLYIDGQSVAYDAYVYSGGGRSGVYYYYTDYDTEDGEGTLYYYEKGKPVKVADDVYDYYLMGDKEVMYLSNYSTSRYKGELYLFSKKKTNMLDDDVVCFLRPNSSSTRNIYSVTIWN